MKKASNIWTDYRADWLDDPQARGPDPRIRNAIFVVYSRDALTDLGDAFADCVSDGIDEYTECFETLAAAKNAYETRIRRQKTKQCDIQLHLTFGSVFFRLNCDRPLVPQFSETYIYLVRWRADGAFLESYHINESRFGERQDDVRTDELSRTTKRPGLMAYYVQEHEKTKNNKD